MTITIVEWTRKTVWEYSVYMIKHTDWECIS